MGRSQNRITPNSSLTSLLYPLSSINLNPYSLVTFRPLPYHNIENKNPNPSSPLLRSPPSTFSANLDANSVLFSSSLSSFFSAFLPVLSSSSLSIFRVNPGAKLGSFIVATATLTTNTNTPIAFRHWRSRSYSMTTKKHDERMKNKEDKNFRIG